MERFINHFPDILMMEILGVPHSHEYLNAIDKYISDKYGEGLESLMLEIPPLPEWVCLHQLQDGFFSDLARKYQETGTRIIYGDLNGAMPIREDAGSFAKFFHGINLYVIGNLFRSRNKGMAEAVRAENPELVVVGGAHAIYLKKTFPESYFIGFDTKKPKYRFLYKNADEIFIMD